MAWVVEDFSEQPIVAFLHQLNSNDTIQLYTLVGRSSSDILDSSVEWRTESKALEKSRYYDNVWIGLKQVDDGVEKEDDGSKRRTSGAKGSIVIP